MATSIARELVDQAERFGASAALPRVRALHLPPPSAAGTREGEFCALELDDGSVGISFVLLDDTLARLMAGDGGALAGADPLAVARRFADGDGPERTVAFAALHALAACLQRRAGYEPADATDSIGLIDPRPGDHVGMIGLFPPLVGRVIGAGARLTVVELKPQLAGERDGYRVTLDPGALRDCNKVLSTSTILLNDTADRMIACCASATTLAVVGPGAGILPDALFARGVTLVGGTRIVDVEGFRTALRTGARWGASARKYAIPRTDYPGFAALLARAPAAHRGRSNAPPAS